MKSLQEKISNTKAKHQHANHEFDAGNDEMLFLSAKSQNFLT